jgi:hypothetical protein
MSLPFPDQKGQAKPKRIGFLGGSGGPGEDAKKQ